MNKKILLTYMAKKRFPKNGKVPANFKYNGGCHFHSFIEQNGLTESQKDKIIKILHCLCFKISKVDREVSDGTERYVIRRKPSLEKQSIYQIQKNSLGKARIKNLDYKTVRRILNKIQRSDLITTEDEKYLITFNGLAYLYSQKDHGNRNLADVIDGDKEWINDNEALKLFEEMLDREEEYTIPEMFRGKKITKDDLPFISLYGASFNPIERGVVYDIVEYIPNRIKKEILKEEIEKAIKPLLKDDEELEIILEKTDPRKPVKVIVHLI